MRPITGVTPLMVAGEENNVALAEFLLAKGADVGHVEVHGYAPITRAIWKGNFDIVRLFKRHGVTCPPLSVSARRNFTRAWKFTNEQEAKMHSGSRTQCTGRSLAMIGLAVVWAVGGSPAVPTTR